MTELAPSFTCEKCGRGLGASRENDGPWVPSECHWCVYLPKMRKDVARRRALGHVVVGVDLDKALVAYSRMAPFKGSLGKIKLEVAHRMERGTRGTAYMGRRKIRIAAGPDATQERVLEVLVHEMTHLAVPNDVQHSERFRLTFRRACLNLWGIDVPLDAPPRGGCIAYGMGDLASEKLKEKIANGEIELFKPDPKTQPTKPTRAELSAKRVEKNEAHAIRMLARAEKDEKNAHERAAKWRRKVAYYERKAARKAQ